MKTNKINKRQAWQEKIHAEQTRKLVIGFTVAIILVITFAMIYHGK